MIITKLLFYAYSQGLSPEPVIAGKIVDFCLILHKDDKKSIKVTETLPKVCLFLTCSLYYENIPT